MEIWAPTTIFRIAPSLVETRTNGLPPIRHVSTATSSGQAFARADDRRGGFLPDEKSASRGCCRLREIVVTNGEDLELLGATGRSERHDVADRGLEEGRGDGRYPRH